MRSQGKKRKAGKRKVWTEQAILNALNETLSKDFPNPKRIGCPSQEALERNAKDILHGDAAVTRHVVQCSPCYREYGRLLRQELVRIEAESTPRKAKPKPKRSAPKKN